MRTTSTFSVLFWIYAKRTKNNETNIYARITVNGKGSTSALSEKSTSTPGMPRPKK